MSAPPDDQSDGRRVSLSKVTFSRISSELLVVNIKKMNEEMREEDIPKPSIVHKPPMRKSRSYSDKKTTKNNSKFTMTEERVTASSSSQTLSKKQSVTGSQTEKSPNYTPCLKHAAQNLSRKASDVPSEKINLCNNCSKSMLSYIFLVQDFLDSLAKEISGGEGSQCLQCARKEVRDNVANLDTKAEDSSLHRGQSERNRKNSGQESRSKAAELNDDGRSKRPSRTRSSRQETKRNEDQQNRVANPHQASTKQQGPQVEFLYNVSPGTSQAGRDGNVPNQGGENRSEQDKQQSYQQNVPDQQQAGPHHPPQTNQQTAFDSQSGGKSMEHQSVQPIAWDSNQQANAPPQSNEQQSLAQPAFRPPAQRVQPNYDHLQVDPVHQEQNIPVQHSPTVFKDGVDGIVSTLSNAEREIYDSARNGAGWESLTGPQERLGLSPENVVASEAYVTFCRNNAEAIGCLVVGTSLLLCRTTRTLCVLVSDGVSMAFKGALSSVFQVVQFVRSLDSLGTTKLALLEQPELGITFDKLNIWRLVQFSKCVYLNPDTLVIQNCDELFSREELSAVPDIGWPDCFNSGVFVFKPSIQTFWNLLEFSEKQGSYDGGDQGLLNSYYNSWSSDISKKLSFIYNLMANVSYTYTPAFRQFGRDVKIVQFHGSFKPWHVKFFPNSGQVSPSSPVHPTYIQFVHVWLNIFRISVLRLMSQEIQSYASSQETICAVEILRFFPLPTESESDFFLTPPSVRLRLAERKLSTRTASLPLSEARRRKSAEFSRYTDPEERREPEKAPDSSSPAAAAEKEPEPAPPVESVEPEEREKEEETDMDEVFKKLEEAVEKKGEEEGVVKDPNALPGAEVGNYQGMKAWEQGRMDYQGADSSDNVIKRLQFLMSRSK